MSSIDKIYLDPAIKTYCKQKRTVCTFIGGRVHISDLLSKRISSNGG